MRYETFKQITSFLAALFLFLVGLWLLIQADGITTQFGVGLLMMSYAPKVLYDDEEGR